VSPVFHNYNILVTSDALFEPVRALLQDADRRYQALSGGGNAMKDNQSPQA